MAPRFRKKEKTGIKVNVRPGCFYYVDKEGNVYEMEIDPKTKKAKSKKVVGKLPEREKGAFYFVDKNGDVWVMK